MAVLTPAGGHSERRMSQVLTRRFTSTRGRARVPGVLGVRSGEEELAVEAPALRPPSLRGLRPAAVLGLPTTVLSPLGISRGQPSASSKFHSLQSFRSVSLYRGVRIVFPLTIFPWYSHI